VVNEIIMEHCLYLRRENVISIPQDSKFLCISSEPVITEYGKACLPVISYMISVEKKVGKW